MTESVLRLKEKTVGFPTLTLAASTNYILRLTR